MTSPPRTTNNPRTVNRLFTSSTSTARQLCKGRRSPKGRHLCKAIEDTEAEGAGTTEAEEEKNLLTKSTGKISNVLFVIRRYIHQRVAQKQKITLMDVPSYYK